MCRILIYQLGRAEDANGAPFQQQRQREHLNKIKQMEANINEWIAAGWKIANVINSPEQVGEVLVFMTK